jgi:hypothetical protein
MFGSIFCNFFVRNLNQINKRIKHVNLVKFNRVEICQINDRVYLNIKASIQQINYKIYN